MKQSVPRTSRAGDTFKGRIVDPVYRRRVEVIRAGSHIVGRITAVQKAAKKGKPGTLSVAFYKVELPNGRSKNDQRFAYLTRR